jgi:hypothetical protein
MQWLRYVIGLVVLLAGPALLAQSARSYVSGSVRLALPTGPLAESTDLGSSAQFDVRYSWSPSRRILLGIGGAWMTASMGNGLHRETWPLKGPLSITQITATATWRPIKHGWSPYVGVEGGFGFLNPSIFESTLGAAYGAYIGTFIPLSERLDLSVSGRWLTLATSTPLNQTLVSVELVYRIQ